MLPPDIIIPTFLFLNNFLFFETAAKAIEHEGSTIIFILSKIILIYLMILFSGTVRISSTSSCIIGKVIVPTWALKPSQMVFVFLFD